MLVDYKKFFVILSFFDLQNCEICRLTVDVTNDKLLTGIGVVYIDNER